MKALVNGVREDGHQAGFCNTYAVNDGPCDYFLLLGMASKRSIFRLSYFLVLHTTVFHVVHTRSISVCMCRYLIPFWEQCVCV